MRARAQWTHGKTFKGTIIIETIRKDKIREMTNVEWSCYKEIMHDTTKEMFIYAG